MNTKKVTISMLLVTLLLFSAVSLTPRASAVSNSTLVIAIDGGVLQFPGETAVFYFTTTANGNVVNPTNMTVTIYFPNNVNNMVLTPTQVTTGVFMVSWTIPANAVTGFYALVVSASYQYGTFGGLAVKGFEISQGLQNNQNQIMTGIGGLSSQLSSVEANILTKLYNTTAIAASPAVVTSALLGAFFLPNVPAAASMAFGFALLTLMTIAILLSASVLLKRRSIGT